MERQDKGQDIVLVASEPLTFERADWVTVPSNCNILTHGADRSDVDNQWTDSVAAPYYWYCIVSWLMQMNITSRIHCIRDGVDLRRARDNRQSLPKVTKC
jgi:hypothetical protein